jgi:hypothetical protein
LDSYPHDEFIGARENLMQGIGGEYELMPEYPFLHLPSVVAV